MFPVGLVLIVIISSGFSSKAIDGWTCFRKAKTFFVDSCGVWSSGAVRLRFQCSLSFSLTLSLSRIFSARSRDALEQMRALHRRGGPAVVVVRNVIACLLRLGGGWRESKQRSVAHISECFRGLLRTSKLSSSGYYLVWTIDIDRARLEQVGDCATVLSL